MNRVAKLVEIGKIELFEEPIPALEDDYVVVKLEAVGICGSDLHYFKEGGLGSFKNPLPMDIGHEPAGTVVMSDVDLLPEGVQVAIEPGRVCLDCKYCHQGKHNLCQNVTFMGANAPGAFRDYIKVHKSQCFKVDSGWSPNFTALLEPLGVAAHTLNRIDPAPFSEFIIFGAGPIGLCMADVLRQAGHTVVAIVDPQYHRRKMAVRRMDVERGFTDTEIIESGITADYVIDCAGFQAVIDKAFRVVNPGGKVALVGIPEVDNLTYNPHKMRIKEVDVVNVRRSNQNLDRLIDLYDRMPTNIHEIVTHEFELEDIQQAFEIAAGYQNGVIKAMIVG